MSSHSSSREENPAPTTSQRDSIQTNSNNDVTAENLGGEQSGTENVDQGLRKSELSLNRPSSREHAEVSLPQDGNTIGETRQEVGTLERVPSAPPHSVFSKRLKRYIVFLTGWSGFFSPLSASIYFPVLNTLARELNVSIGVINLTLTSYMIFQGLAPTFFGDLGDMFGRRPAYILSFTIYLGANIGLALQTNYAALFILRCVQSTGSSGTIALANGVVADIAASGERGKYIGYVILGPMAGPAIAPIIGGVLAQFLGWRAIFWFLTIMAGVFMIPFCVSFPETGRNVVGNGSIPPPKWNMSLVNYMASRKDASSNDLSRSISQDEKRAARAELARKRKFRLPNPMKTLRIIAEKDVGILLVYNAIIYTAFYDVIATVPSLFAEIYGYNDLQIAGGYLMDFNYRRVAKRAGFKTDIKRGDDLRNFPLEQARIQIVWPCVCLGMAAMLCYGWVLERKAHLAAPLVLQFIMGFAISGVFNVISIMLVDLYPMSPSTATAANNLVRCFAGAAGTAVVNPMIDGMGRGWCFTFLTAVVVASSPLLWVETKWGPRWREERRVRVEKRNMDSNAGQKKEESKG
ncbi:MAG: hypothetical protein Q9191_006507 [Dirinaria sp. TL-2023a]